MPLFEAFLLPTGEVETFLDTMRLATKISESNLPTEDEERVSGSGAEVTYGMIERIRNFINKEALKALVSMEEA